MRKIEIRGTKGNIDVSWDGRMMRFFGDLCSGGLFRPYFVAIADSAIWLPPYENEPVSDETRAAIIKAVEKQTHRKIRFTHEAQTRS